MDIADALVAHLAARLALAAEREARPAERGFWYWLARLVMRRPVPIAVASAAVLIGLGIPFTQMRAEARWWSRRR